MKKILLFASALAGLFAASCQRENLEPVGPQTVSFTVEAPGALATKGTINAGATIADGTNVNEVHYAVYKTNSGEDYSIDDSGAIDGPLAQGVVPMSNKKATINFDLLQDQNYTVLFWAQVKDADHYNLGDLRTIEVATSVAGNDETRAAFYARYDFETYNHKDHKVTLRRPFAQLNLLTTAESLTPVQTGQTTGYTIDVKTSEVVVTGLATTFNTLTGLAPAGDQTFVFQTAETPEEQGQETLVVNGKAYHYVSMNYFFVPEDEKLVDIKYTVNTDKGTIKNEIVAVPVKENYRTNVIGNLLTKESTFEIVVDSNFDGQELVQVWDGREVSMPVVNEAGEYEISFASELAWLAAAVNGTLPVTEMEQIESVAPQGFKGVTFKLVEDIDLEGALWTPIGNHSYDRMFAGTFDGNGHVISNLVVNNADNAGLFGELCGATIKNVTIENFNLTADHYAGAIVGWVEVGATPTFVQNCIVRKGEITVNVNNKDLGDKAGSIVGFAHGGTYTNNTASEVVIKGYRDLGGIAGHLQSNGVVSNNKVNNVTIIADQTPEYAEVKAANPGKFVGRTAGNASVVDNVEDDVIIKIIGGSDADIKAVIDNAKDGDTIYFDGIYGKFPSIGKALNVICAEGTTFQGNSKLNLNPNVVVNGATFSNPSGNAVDQTITGTFKNCTFTGYNAIRSGYTGTTCYFENCVFSGAVYGCHFDGKAGNEVYFKNCTFSGFNAFAAAIPLATFDACTFEANGRSGYNGGNFWGNTKLENTVFKFDGRASTQWIGMNAAQDGKSIELNGCKVLNAEGAEVSFLPYVSNIKVDNKFMADGVEYTYLGESVFEAEGAYIVYNVTGLNAAIAKYSNVKLVDGVYEGLFYVNGKSIDIEALNEGKATINGKLAIAASGKTVNVKGIVFENSYAGSVAAGHQYLDKTGKYCIGLYCASVNVENCTFNLYDNGAINFYAVNAPERCTVKNSTFNCNGFRPILSKADITVDGCTFNDQYKYALQVWGNANSGSESVVFTNNTINNPGATSACEDVYKSYVSVSKSYELANVAFTISGNTPGCNFVYDNSEKVDITSCTLNGAAIVAAQCYPVADDINEVAMPYEAGWTYVTTVAGVKAALTANENVRFVSDITVAKGETETNGYGITGLYVKNGQTIDGNGKKLAVSGAGATWDSALAIKSGLVKNLTITKGFRGIFITNGTEKVVLENVTVQGPTYTISCDKAGNQGLEAYNSTFNGWTSYAATIGTAYFEGCSFGKGAGYNFSRPYAPARYVNCNFAAGHAIDPRAAITFENCTIDGVALTADNLATLVTSNIANATVIR